MTKDCYEKLKPFEKQMKLAQSISFCRFSRGELNTIASVYEDMFGVKMSGKLNCNACVLNMVKRLYEEYTKYEKWYNARFGNSKDSNPVEEIAAE